MSCDECVQNFFEVETEDAIYQFEFSEVQFEITGVCNMDCVHCRGAYDEKIDLPVEQIKKVLNFVRKYSPNFKEVTISGGEPLLHKQFKEVLKVTKEANVSYLTITTNGSLIDKDIIEYIKNLDFGRVSFSVSLDSLDSETHNRFRNNDNAYESAINAFRLLKQYGSEVFQVSLRSTITPDNIKNMDNIVKFAIDMNLDRVSFSTVLPSGKAASNPELLMTGKQLIEFCDNVVDLYKKYKGKIDVSSNEALKWQSRMQELTREEGKLLLHSCPAGTVSFNVNSNGDVTPCSLLSLPMFNIMNLSVDEIENSYRNNHIVKSLLTRDLKGKCGECKYRVDCTGCRVRALGTSGDYLGEDPYCTKGPF